jgi:hypothetical protein
LQRCIQLPNVLPAKDENQFSRLLLHNKKARLEETTTNDGDNLLNGAAETNGFSDFKKMYKIQQKLICAYQFYH